jgi:hypothetical protein
VDLPRWYGVLRHRHGENWSTVEDGLKEMEAIWEIPIPRHPRQEI